MPPSTADPVRPHDNNFDAIRLVAATTVLVGHGWPLSGHGVAPAVGQLPIYDIAVDVFFATSGYLISQSWDRTRSAWRFLVRRVARIFPALLVVVVLTVLVVGPLTTTLPLGRYLADPETWAYLRNATLLATYSLPGVFRDNPVHAVNGSLWTLGPEFCCYLLVLAVGILTIRRRGVALVVAFVAVGALALIPLPALDGARAALTASVFFVGGAVLARVRSSRALPLAVPVAGAALLGLGVLAPAPVQLVLWFVGLPAVVVGVGERSWPLVRRAARFGDFSYGVYLWGFVVEQCAVHALGTASPPLVVSTALVVTAALAVASYHVVEAPILTTARTRTQQAAPAFTVRVPVAG